MWAPTSWRRLDAGIRNQRRGKTMRKWMGQWAFAQLEFMLRYKCRPKGIEVVEVDAYFTSQRCNDCGDVDKRSRAWGVYRCVACGHKDNSDINAAKNIATSTYSPHTHEGSGRRYQPPIWMRTQSPASKPRALRPWSVDYKLV